MAGAAGGAASVLRTGRAGRHAEPRRYDRVVRLHLPQFLERTGENVMVCIATDWTSCVDELPPLDEVVMTKIDDSQGCRNEQRLKRFQRSPECRSLWFLPDGSMYVYYTPTHWRRL